MVNKKIIIQLALATIVGMPLAAIVIDRISDSVDLATSIIGLHAWWLQILLGLGVGLVSAFVAQLIINSPLLNKVNKRYANMLGRFDLNWSEIIFISVCAGVGEELLFRGALQPLLGILLTSIVFVAIHGYLNPKDWRLSLYGVYMTVVIAIIGFLTLKSGLIASMIAHTVIDIYLLYKLQQSAGGIEVTENPGLTDTFTDDENEMDQ
ncbi:MAG: CPBP family intramembrane glutamic endopeptidase [Flavobacteriales bacterium]